MNMRIGVSLPVRELRDDLGAIRDFASQAEQLGFTHLRIPEQIVRKQSGHLHEPLTLLAYLAACTRRIELVPSVLVLPARQTALVAKQAAEIDILCGGRLRLGIGVGSSRREYEALGQHFETRGQRCSEQMGLLKRLWTEEDVSFDGEFDQLSEVGTESGLAVAGHSEKEWLGILQTRKKVGITHLCMRTLGGDLDAAGHLAELARIHRVLVGQGHIDG